MPILASAEVPGLPPERDDALLHQQGYKRTGAPGCIAHSVAPIAGGVRVTERWAAREALDAFVASVVLPTMQAAGLPAIQPQVRPVHNRNIAGWG